MVSNSLPALGICLEDYEYPYPVETLRLTNDLQLTGCTPRPSPTPPTARRSSGREVRRSRVRRLRVRQPPAGPAA